MYCPAELFIIYCLFYRIVGYFASSAVSLQLAYKQVHESSNTSNYAIVKFKYEMHGLLWIDLKMN